MTITSTNTSYDRHPQEKYKNYCIPEKVNRRETEENNGCITATGLTVLLFEKFENTITSYTL
jgi:hypothetical protein